MKNWKCNLFLPCFNFGHDGEIHEYDIMSESGNKEFKRTMRVFLSGEYCRPSRSYKNHTLQNFIKDQCNINSGFSVFIRVNNDEKISFSCSCFDRTVAKSSKFDTKYKPDVRN